MNVAIYTRVFLDMKENPAVSVKTQLDELRTFAKNNDFIIYKEYVDEDVPAKIVYTPTLKSLIEDRLDNMFEKVLVYKINIFSRYGRKIIKLINEDFKKNNIGLILVTENFDLDTLPGQSFMDGFVSAVQVDHSRAVDRYTYGMFKNATKGLVVQHWMSYGYKRSDDGSRRWAIDDREAMVVKQIFDWHLTYNLSSCEIARRLTLRKIPTKRSKKIFWGQSSIRKILKNPIYKGTATFGGVSIDVPCLINPKEWDKAQEITKKRIAGTFPLTLPQ